VRNAIRLTVGVAVSIGCLYLATRGTEWGDVGRAMARARAGWVAALFVASVLTVYIRAQRWRVLLRPLGDVPLYPALSATAIGFGASSVLPFRLGEILRPALLGRHAGVGLTGALSSVVLERLFDMLLVIVCFLALSLVYRMPAGLRDGAWVLGTLATLGFALLVAMQRNRDFAERLIARILGWLPARLARGLTPLGSSFLNGLGALADIRTVLLVLAYSAYLWGVIVLTFLFGMLALDIGTSWTASHLVAASLAVMVVVAAAVFLPQAPGFVGTWQYGCVLALHTIFHVPKEMAVGYSLLTWVVQMLVNILTAGVFLAREDFSWREIRGLVSQNAPPAEVEAK
jgi:hypothetical protein